MLVLAVVFFVITLTADFRISPSRDYTRDRAQAGPQWSTPVNISNTPDGSWSPQIGVDRQGKAYVVWSEWLNAGGFHIYFNTNKSGQWGSAQRVYIMNSTADDAGVPQLVTAPDGTCHMALHDILTDVYDVAYFEYTNSWSSRYNVSQSGGPSVYVTLGISPIDNYLYAVYMDGTIREFDIMYRFRNPDKQWGVIDALPIQTISNFMPQMTIDGKGTAHVVYHLRTGGNSIVYYTKNPEPRDNLKWTAPFAVGATGMDWCFPKIASDNAGDVYVIWRDFTQGNDEIFFRRTVNQVWQNAENMSKSNDISEGGDIAVNMSSGEIYIVWQEFKGGTDWEVYLKAYEELTPGGEKKWYSEPLNLTNNSNQSGEPSVAVTEKGDVHIAYLEKIGTNPEIWYTYKEKIKVYPPTNVALVTLINKLLFYDEKINRITFSKNALNDDSNLANYELYRRKANEGNDKLERITTLSATTFSYDDRQLLLTEKYAYALKAVDKQGNKSEYSTVVTEK